MCDKKSIYQNFDKFLIFKWKLTDGRMTFRISEFEPPPPPMYRSALNQLS